MQKYLVSFLEISGYRLLIDAQDGEAAIEEAVRLVSKDGADCVAKLLWSETDHFEAEALAPAGGAR